MIVADVLPAGTTFQALCKRQKQLLGGGGGAPLALQKALRLFARSGASSSSSADGSSTDAATAQELAPSAELVADFDSAALLGLAPALEASSSGWSTPSTPKRSRVSLPRSGSGIAGSGSGFLGGSSGGSSGILGTTNGGGSSIPRSGSREWSPVAPALAAALAAPAAASPPPPSWCDAPKGMQLLAAVVSAQGGP